MSTYDTATITRAEARLVMRRLTSRVREHSHHAWTRGLHTASDNSGAYRAAVDEDDRTRSALHDELELVETLILGLIEERTVSATAMRLIEEARA